MTTGELTEETVAPPSKVLALLASTAPMVSATEAAAVSLLEVIVAITVNCASRRRSCRVAGTTETLTASVLTPASAAMLILISPIFVSVYSASSPSTTYSVVTR